MRRGGRGDDQGFDRLVLQHVLEVGGAAHRGVPPPRQLESLLAAIAAPHELGAGVLHGYAGEMRTPIAETDEGEAHGRAHQTALASSAPAASRTATATLSASSSARCGPTGRDSTSS